MNSHFLAFNISPVPRIQNLSADLLANVSSKLILVELIFQPSIPHNITNWKVFNDDVDILIFLTLEGTYRGQIIDDSEHDRNINMPSDENSFPKHVVKL